MRIGFDAKRAYHNNTGLGNYSRDLIRGLANKYREDQYVLFTPSVSRNPRSAFINYFPNITPITPSTLFDKSLKSYWRSINLENDLIKQKIDIYHGLSQEIPKRKGGNLKYVVTIHDLIFLRYPETYKAIDRKIYDKKFRYAAAQSDLVIAISEQTKSDLIEFYNTDPEKIRVVYQSCHDQFKQSVPESAKHAIVKKYKLPSEYILYVGTIEKRKNLKTLVDACRTIDLPIVAVGQKTSYFKDVMSTVAKNKMENRMFFLEDIPFEDLPGIYQSATVFCYPSVFEGFGIPIIEALYSKIPVITSKGGVFKETGGEASQYADPLSVEDLRAKLLIALERDNSEQVKLGYKFVQRFSTEQFVKGVKNVYNELM
jgi:glycosyltransferase involved in cell wall biosynthesis